MMSLVYHMLNRSGFGFFQQQYLFLLWSRRNCSAIGVEIFSNRRSACREASIIERKKKVEVGGVDLVIMLDNRKVFRSRLY